MSPRGNAPVDGWELEVRAFIYRRGDIAALTKDAAEISRISHIRDMDADEVEEMLNR